MIEYLIMPQPNKNPIEGPSPLVELNEDTRKRVDAMAVEIAESEKNVEALEELGMDTSRLREIIEWAKKAREIILRRLT